MNGRRGQIALFVIIAILIVGSIVFIYAQKGKIGASNYVDPEVLPIKIHVDSCLEKVSLEGMSLIGLQGGYSTLPNTILKANFSTIAYGYYAGKRILPTKSGVEKQLNDYINLALPACTDFTRFSDYSITSGKVSSDARIRDNYTDFVVDWPLTIKKGTMTLRLNSFESKADVRLGKVYFFAENIVNLTVSDPKSINVGYLIEQDEKEGFRTDLVPYGSSLIYAINDPNSTINNLSYTFLMAVRF